MEMKIGWKAGSEQYEPNELLKQVIAAEKAGFETVDVSDHFHPWSEEGQACFTWAWLGAAATHTSKIELGTGVACPILRYHPSIIAQAAATIGCFAPNRFYLGLGTGEALNEYAATGFWPGYNQRQEMLREAIVLMRKLLEGNEVTFTGEYYQTKKAKLYTNAPYKIPFILSTLVPESASFAGEVGDGLITVGGKSPAIYKQMLTNFDEAARKAGKNPKTMPKMIELNVALTDEREKAFNEMKKYWAGTFIPALFDQKIYTPKMSAENGAIVSDEAMEKLMCLSNSSADHVAFIQSYRKLGFTHIFVHSAGPDQLTFLQQYGKEVLPKLKKIN